MKHVSFPDLQVIPLARCVLHEETDAARVKRLMHKIETEQVLRNPPIVGRHVGLDSLIVLDGATRVTALRTLEVPHVVAQVVDYDDDAIQLHTWSHLLSDITLDRLLADLEQVSLTPRACSQHEVSEALIHRETLAYLSDRSGRSFAIAAGEDVVSQTIGLQRLFKSYAGRSTIARVPPAEWQERLRTGKDQFAIIFPIHTKADLVALAQANAVLPAGITRHIIPGRALRINAPLALMQDQRTLAEKQQQLDDWIHERKVSHGVRYYAEPTFLFDE